MSPLKKLILRTRMEAQWEMAVRQQRLLERIQDPSGVECPCGAHIQEELYRTPSAV